MQIHGLIFKFLYSDIPLDKNFGFFGRYFAKKSDFGKHGKENCKENSTVGKIGKKSGKSAIFQPKIGKF